MGYVCRYTPTSRLVLRAAVTAEYYSTWTAPFEERRVARHGLKLRPTPVFLNAILHGITRATLGPALPLVHHVSV